MCKLTSWTALAVVVCISFSSIPLAEARNRYLSKGIKFIDQAEDEQAIATLRRALRWKGNTPVDLTKIHLYLGIAHFNLLQKETASMHFKAAIKLNPKVQAPDDVSPLIETFLEEIKSKERSAGTPSTPTPGVEVFNPRADPNRPVPEVVTVSQSQDQPEGRYWPGWLCVGVAAAALGTGITMGVLSGNHADEAKDPSRNYNDQVLSHEKASDFALVANIMYGVAGASAIAAGILFWVGMPEKQTSAVVVPVPGGAVVQINGFSW